MLRNGFQHYFLLINCIFFENMATVIHFLLPTEWAPADSCVPVYPASAIRIRVYPYIHVYPNLRVPSRIPKLQSHGCFSWSFFVSPSTKGKS